MFCKKGLYFSKFLVVVFKVFLSFSLFTLVSYLALCLFTANNIFLNTFAFASRLLILPAKVLAINILRLNIFFARFCSFFRLFNNVKNSFAEAGKFSKLNKLVSTEKLNTFKFSCWRNLLTLFKNLVIFVPFFLKYNLA